VVGCLSGRTAPASREGFASGPPNRSKSFFSQIELPFAVSRCHISSRQVSGYPTIAGNA